MHITIIGAGIIGCLTAYYLRQDGHEITLIDKNPIAGNEASAANAGQLSYTDTPPLGGPALWHQLPKIALGLHPRISIESPFDRDLWRFAHLLLTRECSSTAFQKNHAKLQLYAKQSQQLMTRFIQDTDIKFDHKTIGRVIVFDKAEDLSKRVSFCTKMKQEADTSFDALSATECRKRLPFLKDRKGPAIAGGVYLPDNAIGDCALFCQNLIENILNPDPKVTCIFDEEVTEIINDGQKISGVKTKNRTITTDHYILCAGAWAAPLLKPLGIVLPIYPIRGYNITFPKPADLTIPHSFTDMGHQIVFTPFGKRIRASMGFEMAGFHKKIPIKSHRMITHTLHKVLPKVDLRDAEIKVGFRPFTPNSRPIIRHSQKYSNLTCHVGHGMYGWTLAQSCAYQAAKLFK